MTRAEQLRRLAREALGIETLRPGQVEIAEAVLDGRDALAIMATGYGKSAIYQLAGLLIDGPTLVVSPLIRQDAAGFLGRQAASRAAALRRARRAR